MRIVNVMPLTDEELLAVLRVGDADESMRLLFRTYGGALYGFAFRRLGDAGLAEEVVQETMLRIWQHAERFDRSEGSVRAWLYEIATNLVIDAHRRRVARPPLDGRGQVEIEASSDEFEHEMLRWQLRSAIAQLRPEHREVIALVHFEGLKLREVADRLRIPLGTVKSRCFYALENLRVALEEQGLSK